MEYDKLFVSIVLFCVLCLNFSLTQLEDDHCYTAIFTEGTKPCDSFKNELFICNLNIEIAPESDEGESGMVLTGEMEVKEEFQEDCEVELNIWKDIGTGRTYMYNIQGNLCDSLKKNDTPWRPMTEGLKTEECPVKTGVYTVDNMRISLDFAKNVLNHEFCGEYVVETILKTPEKIISCYEIGLEVVESTC